MAELGGLNERNEEVKEVRIQIVRKVISTSVEPTKNNFSIGGVGDSDPGGKNLKEIMSEVGVPRSSIDSAKRRDLRSLVCCHELQRSVHF